MIRSTSCVQSGRNRILVHSPRNIYHLQKRLIPPYRYPQPINDSIVIAVKSGLKDINSLVIINNGREKHLDYIGSINSRLSYQKRPGLLERTSTRTTLDTPELLNYKVL